MRWSADSMFQDGTSGLPTLIQKGLGCALLQDMQSRQDEEIDALYPNAFLDSEALETQREHWNMKYMCVLVPLFPSYALI